MEEGLPLYIHGSKVHQDSIKPPTRSIAKRAPSEGLQTHAQVRLWAGVCQWSFLEDMFGLALTVDSASPIASLEPSLVMCICIKAWQASFSSRIWKPCSRISLFVAAASFPGEIFSMCPGQANKRLWHNSGRRLRQLKLRLDNTVPPMHVRMLTQGCR